jgi:cytochrome P450
MEISLWVSVPIGTATALVLAAHFYYKNAFKFWKQRGIDGPPALPFVGNFGKLLMDREAPEKWMREHGKIYGIYEGTRPVLVISDPELMGQICIKDFNKFPNHPTVELNSELSNSFVFGSKDDHWRHMRAILSPTFTSGKMRRMFKLLDICTNTMLEAMDERLKSGPIVHLKDLFNLYTMDAIASCCYGLRLASYKNEASLATAANQDEFVKMALKLFDISVARVVLISVLHTKILRMLGIRFISGKAEWEFANRVRQIIKNRRESGKHFDDYLQTLIDAQSDKRTHDSQSNDDHLDSLERHHAGDLTSDDSQESLSKQKNWDSKPMSEIEVLASATFLLVVGLETTSALLTSCFYALAWHQEVQEKLYQTIKSLAKADEHKKLAFDYESLISCP